MEDRIAFVTCGPYEHGIVRFGRELARSARAAGFTGIVAHEQDPLRLNDVVAGLPRGVRVVHLQINDWLLNSGPARPEDRLTAFAAAVRAAGARLTLTLHDLPHPDVSAALFRRRCASYRAMVAAATTVVVCSDHERTRLEDVCGEDPSTPVEVIRLPITALAASASQRRVQLPAASVGVLGFIYPGKGHDDVLNAITGIEIADSRPTLVAIGRPSDGHESLTEELTARACALGVGFLSTGFVPDSDLPDWLHAVDVPVAPAHRISASASINTWIAAGRRPLVLDGPYSREFEHHSPGSLRRYTPGELAGQIRRALQNRSLTTVSPGSVPEPDTAAVARRYLRLLADVAREPLR